VCARRAHLAIGLYEMGAAQRGDHPRHCRRWVPNQSSTRRNRSFGTPFV
jgi:hypothetical protein